MNRLRPRATSADCPGETFIALQRLSRFFDDIRCHRRTSAAQERAALRLTRNLGATAVPLCTRKLASSSDAEAEWAYRLLTEMSAAPAVAARITGALRQLAAAAATDRAATRALALLAELGAEPPAGVAIREPAAVHRRSLADLAASLTTAAEVARAADSLVPQLEPGELWELVDDLAAAEPPAAFALAGELVARDDVQEVLRREIRQLRAELAVDLAATRRRSRPVPSTAVSVGRTGDGAVVLARAPVTSRRYRVLCAAIAPDGALVDAYYHDELTAPAIARELERPLAARGYALVPADVPAGAALVAAAARATRNRGDALPRGYYLGRDLLGLADDHLCPSARAPALHLAALLARASALLAAGQPQRARPLFESHVEAAPDDPDGAAGLALCLLALGDAHAAHRHLGRAIALEPDNAVHLWNAAACAHAQGRRGGCYLALAAFLDATGRGASAPPHRSDGSRPELARRYVAEYERIARLEHPQVPPPALARADDLCQQGGRWLDEGRLRQAIAALSRSVDIAPSHYEAWTRLGIAHTRLGELEDAGRCLSRALSLRPAHPAAEAARAELARRAGAAARAGRRARERRPRNVSPRRRRAGAAGEDGGT